MDLTQYRTLGRSGLAVSPLALGTMTFGAGRWGSDAATSAAIIDHYVAAGGNFVDTADVYSGGESEAMLGAMVAERGLRDRLVIATKSGFSRAQGTPLAGGNSARNIRAGLEGSLKRLRTDWIDLYWTHVWDRTTPPEEVLRALTDAVARGDILYYGFSNAPAWYAAQIATLARAHGLPEPIGLQYAYSLVDRGVELDVIPAGQALGMGLVPQGREIFSTLSVRENLRMGLASAPKEDPRIIDDVLADFPRLVRLLDRRGGALSGGEQQLLALARCLCTRPKLVLLDEPTEGIQPSIIEEIIETLLALKKRWDLSMIIVEQNLDFITSLSDRVLGIQKGRITGEVSREDLLAGRIGMAAA